MTIRRLKCGHVCFRSPVALCYLPLIVSLALISQPSSLNNREFEQIATAGADTAAGSKFPPKCDTAHVRRLHQAVARNLTTRVGMFSRSGYYVGLISLFWPFSTDIWAF